MAYNSEYKCLFIHIPKNGGTSIIKSSLFRDSNYIGHRHLEAVEEIIQVPINSVFKFAISRNSWDRVVSVYHHLRQMQETDRWYIPNIKYATLCKEICFDEFCTRIEEFTDEIHLIPQLYWITYRNVLTFDYICEFTRLQEDFNRVCRLIKHDPVELPKENVSEHNPDYRTYYTPKTREIVRNFYKCDIDFFRYTF